MQKLIKISDEEIIDKMEKFLKAERRKKDPGKIKPYSVEELNEIVDKSEEDYKAGRYSETKDLLTKVDQWN